MTTEIAVETSHIPRILVVDDEPRIREACKLVLEECGYEVSLASTGAQALEKIPADHFDIVLLGSDDAGDVRFRSPGQGKATGSGHGRDRDHRLRHAGAFGGRHEERGLSISSPSPSPRNISGSPCPKPSITPGRCGTLRIPAPGCAPWSTTSPTGCMCTNQQNKVALANPAFLRMIGCPVQSMIGRGIEEFIVLPRLLEMISQALEMPESEFSELTEEMALNGLDRPEEIILSIRCAPFRDRNGRNLGVITVVHDITALKLMDRKKSQFVSTVSHEIQSPMNSVLMQLKVILDGLAGEVTEKQRSILMRASEKINNLSSLAAELLNLARIESGLISLEREPVDMAAVIREQVAFLLPRAESESIRLEIDVPEILPLILANRQNMDEVMSNLITNAIKYSPGGGRVTVSASAENEYLCIRVQDTGLGIRPEDLNLIFQQFYRVKDEKTRYINGTGLGLAIVQSILESHQGQIKVESQPGKGSTFSVFLPVLSA